jgi:hypothetical protein
VWDRNRLRAQAGQRAKPVTEAEDRG